MYDVSYYDTLPISEDGEFKFNSPDYTAESIEKNIQEFKEDNNFDNSLTAKQILTQLIKKYEIDKINKSVTSICLGCTNNNFIRQIQVL